METGTDSVTPTIDDVWHWLGGIADPEIPVISLIDLGIIRDVFWDGDELVVALTPTYSGCPATSVIQFDIERTLHEKGLTKLRIEQRLSPAWTTAWMSEGGRKALQDYGIAPPQEGTGADGQCFAPARQGRSNLAVACPRCQAKETEQISAFGSTPCKSVWRCLSCLEPFDYFKCI